MAGCRRLNQNEVIALLSGCQQLFSRSVAERLTAQIVVMLNTGLRVNECCHLRVGDVSRGGEVGPVLSLPRRYCKTDRGRSVALNGFCRRELGRWLDYSGLRVAAATAWLFPPCRGSFSDKPDNYWFDRPVNPKAVRKALKQITAAVAIGGPVSCHSLRKTFGWAVYRASGNDILVAMHALGHSSPMHTLAYLDIAADDVAAAIGRIYAGAVQ